MSAFTKQELEEAHRALTSLMHKCEKVQEKIADHKSQATLNKNRIAAFRIALTLLENEQAAQEYKEVNDGD